MISTANTDLFLSTQPFSLNDTSTIFPVMESARDAYDTFIYTYIIFLILYANIVLFLTQVFRAHIHIQPYYIQEYSKCNDFVKYLWFVTIGLVGFIFYHQQDIQLESRMVYNIIYRHIYIYRSIFGSQQCWHIYINSQLVANNAGVPTILYIKVDCLLQDC